MFAVIRTFVLLSFVSLLLSLVATRAHTTAWAENNAKAIYVDGATGNDANAGTSSAPYKTIAKANEMVTSGAGDTVYVRSNFVYNEALIAPTVNKDNVTYLAWNQNGDAANRLPPVIDTPANVSGFVLQSRHDITIDGFFFRDPGAKWGSVGDSYNIRILNCFFDQAPDQLPQNPEYSGLDFFHSSHHILLQNNHFNRWNQPRSADGTEGNGDMLWVMGLPKNGTEPSAQNPGTHHVLIDRNFFDGFDPANPKNSNAWGKGAHAGHALLNIEGRWNVVRNNIFFNLSQKNVDAIGYIDRREAPLLKGTHDGTQLLFEGNTFKHGTATTNPSGGGGLGLGLAAADNIVRFNKFDRNERAGLQIGAWGDDANWAFVPAIAGNHVYHNTFYRNGYVPDFLNKVNEDAITMFDYRPKSLAPKNSHNNEFRNNLFYDNSGGVSDDGWVQEGTTQMQFYLRHDDGSFGLNQNFVISNLFYRSTGAANNKVLVHFGAEDERGFAQYRHVLQANEWNDQDTTLLGNEYLFRDNKVADPLLDTNTLAPGNGSPAIGAAWPLAYTPNAGTNSVTLSVPDAHWFSDGFGGLVEADTLRLGTTASSPIVKIAAIDYETNIITLAAPATWSADTQIYLYQISDGTRILYNTGPDIGAVQWQGNSGSPTPTPATPMPTPVTPTPSTPTPTPPTATPTGGENLIQNGDFRNGAVVWWIGGFDMTYKFEQEQLCLYFAKPTTHLLHASVYQTGFTLETGKRYRAKAELWSQSAASIKFIAGDNQSPGKEYASQMIDLAAGQTLNYVYEFMMNQTSDPNSGFYFHVGGHTSPKLCLDNIELKVLDDNATATPVPSPTASNTPPPTTTPPTATGQLSGNLKNESNASLVNIRVYAYRLSENIWRRIKRVETDNQGNYLFNELKPGTYRLRFFDPAGRYKGEFYDNATTLKTATDISMLAGSSLTGVDGQLALAKSRSAILEGAVAYSVDEATGRLLINAWLGSTFTIHYPASCGNTNAQVQDVKLQAGNLSFPMSDVTKSGRYRVDLRVPEDLAAGTDYAIEVRWQCVGGQRQTQAIHNEEIGSVSAGSSAASGQVISRLTGKPLVDALVTLYRVPGWRPRSSPSDTALSTCESVASKPTGAAWSQAAPEGLGEWVSPQADEALTGQISPAINPQRTGEDGRFAWRVTEGCWYVEVEAEGYAATSSPVIGVTSALVDLNVNVSGERGVYLPLVRR